jgi:hypothetical protein
MFAISTFELCTKHTRATIFRDITVPWTLLADRGVAT